jgi:hypothetical protein
MIGVYKSATVGMVHFTRAEIFTALRSVGIVMDGAEIRFLVKIPARMIPRYHIPEIDPALKQREFVLIEIPCFYERIRPRDPATFPAHLTARY